jgi:hypothetical protein
MIALRLFLGACPLNVLCPRSLPLRALHGNGDAGVTAGTAVIPRKWSRLLRDYRGNGMVIHGNTAERRKSKYKYDYIITYTALTQFATANCNCLLEDITLRIH